MPPRTLLLASAVLSSAVLIACADAVTAKPGPRRVVPKPFEQAIAAPVVVVGKVVEIEAESVEVAASPNAPQKIAYKVAVIQIDDALAGAKGLTHIKAGFVPAPEGNPSLVLRANQSGCFFLKKHPTADFYTYDFDSTPLTGATQEQIATMKRAIAAVADPAKALKAEKAADRYLAAVAIVTKSKFAVRLPAAETKLLFAAILEADWAEGGDLPRPVDLLGLCGLYQPGGFTPPKFAGNGDYNAFMKAAFQKWVDGPGATYSLGQK